MIRTLALAALATVFIYAVALFALTGCGKRMALTDTSDPSMWADANDGCAMACQNIKAAGCTIGGLANNPACAPNCRNDQAQGAAAQFPLSCIVLAGPDAGALKACGVTCP